MDPSTCGLSPPALSPGHLGTFYTEHCAWGSSGGLTGQRGLPEVPGSDGALERRLANNGQALYSQQKQDWELTVAQIMNSYCQIQTEIEE